MTITRFQTSILIIVVFFNFNNFLLAQIKTNNWDLNDKIQIRLKTNEKRDSIEISESCLVILRNYSTNINLPFGKQFEWKTPTGTRLKV
jgi:hypothetical protein